MNSARRMQLKITTYQLLLQYCYKFIIIMLQWYARNTGIHMKLQYVPNKDERDVRDAIRVSVLN